MDKIDNRIATWNANGILQKQTDIQVFLDVQKIDICLISETHLTTESYIIFRGYNFYHTIHPSNAARGGSTLIIKNNISHYKEPGIQEPENQVTISTINIMGAKLQ